MRVIRATAPGGPEVLSPAEVDEPMPGPGEALVAVEAAGVNFIDTYRRSGVYPATFPHVVGTEGAGTVLAVGEGTQDVAPGDRVGWLAVPGSYAERVAAPVSELVPLPDDVPTATAAAVLLQGITAEYLVDATFPVRPGQHVLVHAGAGGVGLLLTQLARSRGAHVVSTVSTDEKEALSRAAGAEAVRYDRLSDLTAELPRIVRDLTDGGVHTVFDGVGRATFDASLACLRPRGGLALFGGSSGQVPPVDPQRLNAAGSVYLTRPTLAHYTADRAELLERAATVLDAVSAGTLHVRIGATHALEDAARAHADLEARRTTGKVLLVP
ncbi:quinone oxidoreductase family protein [Cellulomonas carbonis]|uniref:NADPH--quinone reductase n=1 Tax=Cellulomonas carbonis T26 TaxID=947969 RepID=A0A0A0BP46_9CELL|nr:quinone oxidoreductase [Cellulomonas carbonis]KGM09467.1 NADPH--quinone reductase [Cellulomonas carbonis T26]GGB96758.1 quinone oxidoreductase [Cellulomonas carbonis]